MQEVNIRKGNCRRFAAQIGQRMNCTQKIQRVRCCGRVLTAQEVSNGLLINGQGRGRGMINGAGQGQGRGMNNGAGQGKGRCMANRQGRGQSMLDNQEQQG